MTTTSDEAKATLHRYLREASDALVWKTEGLSERDLRLPRTPTGTTLLGLVKHAANIEAGYLGETFSRPLPALEGLEDVAAVDADPQADHADILRELLDESAGLRRNGTNLPGEDYDLAAYRQRLREIADRF